MRSKSDYKCIGLNTLRDGFSAEGVWNYVAELPMNTNQTDNGTARLNFVLVMSYTVLITYNYP